MKYLLLALLIFSGCCSTKELNLKVDQIRRSICVKRFNESVFNDRPASAGMILVNKQDELGCWIAKWEFPSVEELPNTPESTKDLLPYEYTENGKKKIKWAYPKFEDN